MGKLNAEFMRALNDIAEQKGIDKEIVLEALEAGLVSAYKKNYNTTSENFKVDLNRKTGEIKVYIQKEVLASDDDIEDDMIQISLEEAKKFEPAIEVGDILNIEDLAITKDKIISEVSAFYNVNSEEIKGKKRTSNIVNARFVAIYLLRTLTEMSSPEIGKEFQRDHTTVLNAETKISDRLKNDPQLEYEINLLIKKIKS